jgi:hypothetical protein
MQRLSMAVAVATCAVAAAGCGGGGSNSKSQSPADFRAEVTNLCTDTEAKINAVDSPSSAKDLSSYLDKVRGIAGPYVDKLDGLNPPSELAGQFNAVVSLNKQELALLDQAKKAVDDGDAQKAAQIVQQQGQKLSEQENAKWRQLGVPKCAN